MYMQDNSVLDILTHKLRINYDHDCRLITLQSTKFGRVIGHKSVK
jgi:hypothetical protein